MIRVPFLDLKAAHQELRPALQEAVTAVLDSCYFIGGPALARFEREFAAYVGAPECIGVGNGLDAITLALRSCDLGPGDEVIVPSHTFIATWLAVAAIGAKLVPVEPAAGMFTIAAAEIARAITPRTRAIIPVHLYGHPAPLDEINELAAQRGIHVIEDAAQAHGARLHGRRIGSHGNIVCWSFYPGKNLGACGDAGAVTTHSAEVAERLRKLRNYGSTKKYYHDLLGTNSRLDDMQAAILAEKCRVLTPWNERRRALAARYLHEIRNPHLELPRVDNGSEPVWHLFVVRTKRRSELQDWLTAHGVETIIHYPVAPHKSAAFAPSFAGASLPSAEAIADEVLSLPMGPHVTPEQASWVIEVINQWPGDTPTAPR
jgi:dTDP-4-amino-4,6-dideoxygalactose transaminase